MKRYIDYRIVIERNNHCRTVSVIRSGTRREYFPTAASKARIDRYIYRNSARFAARGLADMARDWYAQ